MEPRLIKRTIDLALDVQRDPGWGQRLMLVGSALADRLELSVHNAGMQADLTGLTGVVYFKTAEGDVIEKGEVGGNLVAVDFPAEAYAFEGTLVVQVFLSDGKRNVPLYQEVFDIGEGRSDVLIDPSGIVPDLPSVLAMLGELNASKTACDEATVKANNAADAANAASGRAESVIGAVEESVTSANNAAATAEAAGKAATEAAAQMSGVIKEATDAATAANSAANRVDASIQAAANAVDAANGAAARVDSSIQAAVDATSEANTAAENANTATTNANNATVRADAAAEALEKAPVPTGTVSTYQAGTSPTTPPTGTWQSTIPAVPQGQYLWTRTVQSYTNGNPTTYYSVARQGMDGSGSVASVDGVSPDGSGNVQLGAVRSVNGSMPDEDGNVTIEAGGGDVLTVDGVAPDPETGDVPLNAANRDTYMLRLTAEEYEARTLAQRQQDYADGVRGYLVGSGDSVRYGYVLNEDGTTTPQADPGAVQRGEKVELAADASKLGGKSPEYYLQPRNLLDNSDFRNPVNQRGQTSYNSAGYTIDRWTKESNAILTIADDCINIDNSANSAEEVVLQKVDSDTAAKLIGKTVTIAICTSDGTVYAKSGVVAYDVPVAAIVQNGFMLQLQFFRTAVSYQVARLAIGAGSNISVKWIALYEGSYTADTLPPYVPKGYAAELAECQRQYYEIPSNTGFCGYTGSSGTVAYVYVDLPQELRVYKPSYMLEGQITMYFSGSSKASRTINSVDKHGKQIELRVAVDGAPASSLFNGYIGGGNLKLSADL